VREELIAAQHDIEEIRRFIHADSLGYLSLEEMLRTAARKRNEICTACWTDEQPVELPRAEAEQMRLFEKSHR
jgi:amidophosphoribosyltransferase